MFASLGTTTDASLKPPVTASPRAMEHALSTTMANPVAGIALEVPGELFGSPVSGALRTSDAHNQPRAISGNATLKHEVGADFARRCRRGTRKGTARMGLESMKTGSNPIARRSRSTSA